MSSPSLSNNQIPDKSILDQFNRQAYLGNEYTIALAQATITSAVTETPILLFNNPAKSGKTAFQNLRRAAVLTTGNPCIFRFYFNPTITSNGTPVTPACTRIAMSNTSVCQGFLNPTVSSNGILTGILASQAFTADVSEALLIADPGVSILVTVQAATPSPVTLAARISWYELFA